MIKTKFLVYLVSIIFGIFIFIYGGYDDSPGAQLIGAIFILFGIFHLIKNKIKKKEK